MVLVVFEVSNIFSWKPFFEILVASTSCDLRSLTVSPPSVRKAIASVRAENGLSAHFQMPMPCTVDAIQKVGGAHSQRERERVLVAVLIYNLQPLLGRTSIPVDSSFWKGLKTNSHQLVLLWSVFCCLRCSKGFTCMVTLEGDFVWRSSMLSVLNLLPGGLTLLCQPERLFSCFFSIERLPTRITFTLCINRILEKHVAL